MVLKLADFLATSTIRQIVLPTTSNHYSQTYENEQATIVKYPFKNGKLREEVYFVIISNLAVGCHGLTN
jgi:hypothetical protein